MLTLEFFKWWYGSGWQGTLSKTNSRLTQLAERFSVSTLLRTLFAPWRRIISYPGAGLDARMRAMLDNSISRLIGFLIRIAVLIGAGITYIVILILALLEIVAWPLVPAASVGLIIWGII
ncbi:MAG: hypothetical protein ABI220_05150 [Candidatus Saccharimonadales bacterium]